MAKGETHGLSRTMTGHLRTLIQEKFEAQGNSVEKGPDGKKIYPFRVDWAKVIIDKDTDKVTAPVKMSGAKETKTFEFTLTALMAKKGKRGRKPKAPAAEETK